MRVRDQRIGKMDSKEERMRKKVKLGRIKANFYIYKER
jgi:hypothetical protein